MLHDDFGAGLGQQATCLAERVQQAQVAYVLNGGGGFDGAGDGDVTAAVLDDRDIDHGIHQQMLRAQGGCDFIAQSVGHQSFCVDGRAQQGQVQVSLLVDAEGLREFRRIIDREVNKVGDANGLKGQIGASDGDRRCRESWPRWGGRQTLCHGGDREKARNNHYCQTKFFHGARLLLRQSRVE